MKKLSLMTSAALAALIGLQALPTVNFPQAEMSRGPKRRNKTGEKYPFSSKRQNARYARQIAAGQLSMRRVGQ